MARSCVGISFLLRILMGALLLNLLASLGVAQVATGTPPYGSFGGGPFDTVNLGNLNVHFAIPVIHKAGRGMPFNCSRTSVRNVPVQCNWSARNVQRSG